MEGERRIVLVWFLELQPSHYFVPLNTQIWILYADVYKHGRLAICIVLTTCLMLKGALSPSWEHSVYSWFALRKLLMAISTFVMFCLQHGYLLLRRPG
jgi:hypothetical protein